MRFLEEFLNIRFNNVSHFIFSKLNIFSLQKYAHVLNIINIPGLFSNKCICLHKKKHFM